MVIAAPSWFGLLDALWVVGWLLLVCGTVLLVAARPATRFAAAPAAAAPGARMALGVARACRALNGIASAWRNMAAGPLSVAVARAPACAVAFLDRVVVRPFALADRKPIAGVFVAALVVFVLPGLALINAIVGGSPLLIRVYVAALAGLLLLMLLAETRLGRLIGPLAAFVCGVVFLVFAPAYALRSFVDRMLLETPPVAAIEAFLVTPFVLMLVLGLHALIIPPASAATVGQSLLLRLLAWLPWIFALTFVAFALDLGALRVVPPGRTPLLATVVLSAAGLGAVLGCAASRASAKSGFRLVMLALGGSAAAAVAVTVALAALPGEPSVSAVGWTLAVAGLPGWLVVGAMPAAALVWLAGRAWTICAGSRRLFNGLPLGAAGATAALIGAGLLAFSGV